LSTPSRAELLAIFRLLLNRQPSIFVSFLRRRISLVRRRKSRTEATEFTESLLENFEPFCSISFHGSIRRDERKIVLDRLPDEHPVKEISVPS
jgi:hypothetical protein